MTDRPPRAELCPADVDAVRDKISCWRSLRPHEADDILSDALYAFAQRARKEAIQAPQAWLLCAAQLYARNNRRRYLQLQALDEPSAITSQEKLPPGNRTALDAVQEVLSELPDQHRLIIELCDLQRLTVADAARELGVCRSTAKSWRCRAHNRLRHDPRLLALVKEPKS